VNTGGFIWNAPAHFSGNDYVTRIDYNLSRKMKLFGRVSIYRLVQGDDVNFPSAELFPGDPVSNEIIDHSWAFVIGHTWTISNTKVNQFNFGETRSILNFPNLFNPTGTTQYTNLMSSAANIAQLTAPFNGGAFSGNSQSRTSPFQFSGTISTMFAAHITGKWVGPLSPSRTAAHWSMISTL
jgi:hypothetical protein